MDGLAVAEGPHAQTGPETFIHHGHIHHAQHHMAIRPKGHGRPHLGDAVYKIGGAVHGVDDPAQRRRLLPGHAAFFSQEFRLRQQFSQTFLKEGLHGHVRFRHQVDTALVPDGMRFFPLAANDVAALAHDVHHIL